MNEPTAGQVKVLIRACKQLGSLELPGDYGYPSLASCIIDSVQSTGISYDYVRAVVSRYRGCRADQDADASTDTASDLAESFEHLGGAEAWAQRIGTQHKTSTHQGAPLKAVAIQAAARMVVDRGVETVADVRELPASRLAEVQAEWAGIVEQASGITWHYMLMLAGVPGVKPDRMIVRFVANALGLRPFLAVD